MPPLTHPPVKISGAFHDPNFSLTLSSSGFEPAKFTGTVAATSSAARMTGTLDGSGFVDAPATLTQLP